MQLFEKVNDLSLNRHIQSGNRFITDDHLRFEDQRASNTDTLTLTA
ncbi:Uncharacterised protein [Vibrio cholerae]|nr:Uncharacterised protein [Vibrio cholerae]CSI65287.1 Uncharacterised protein [Vibrio cholerae]